MSGKNKGFQGKDSFSRMNFLYQASMLMAGKSDTLSAYYGNLCKSIGKKSVLRIDPNIKRSLCKKCHMALKPGVTADVSAVDCKKEIFSIKCKKCNHSKNFPINLDYKFWLENPDSIAEVCSLEKEKLTKKRKKATVSKDAP
ncbi:uncharacterized protein LOC129912311 [Episyrphus balteatus]|uniref:uncharacterized protein LOC129912310 n=1 Tax=Episyrphus balteatus TaxID=286459 RepID=UPI0024856598|nr:uncharacterized protein LOC129912310 [Episyrphus balteatus]XP_055846498.1 uncharacterized protein LOC129912311 [Episyrphus balteatus]